MQVVLQEWAHEGAGGNLNSDPGEWETGGNPERAQLGGDCATSPPGVEPAESRWVGCEKMDGERKEMSFPKSPRTRSVPVQMVRWLFKEAPTQQREG